MSETPLSLTVAISSECFSALHALPRSVYNKVQSFITKFQQNPTASGLNYEKIQAFKDPKLRSVRIDQTYRGIVLKPDRGDVYLLVWVDHHDKAYRWAENKVYDIHPETGGLQVYSVMEGELPQATHVVPEARDDLFAAWRDRELTRLGIPEPLLPFVRSFKTMAQFEAAQEYLPAEAFEALYFLASGYDYEEIWREMEYSRAKEEVDTEDYAAALVRADSRRRFYVVDNELELSKMLSAPLEQWRVFLHPTQRRLVEMSVNGPVRVLGGAGTGKTVVAMHRARWLAEAAADNEMLLFTTFTRNLAADIRQNLSKICSPDVLRRIEVVNLDKWVVDFLKSQGYEFEIDYGRRTAPLWENALNLAPVGLNLKPIFYRDEWEQVVQANGISTKQEYLRVSRIGRGQRLSRKHRSQIWPVFEEYRAQLTEHNLKERHDAFHDALALLEAKGDILNYKSIIVDEAQDMGMPAFKLIRKMIPTERPNDLFIVGDAHQRIYRRKVTLSHCGINIRGRGYKLRINYRTTEENRRWAVALLKGLQFDDLDGGLDDQKGYRSLMHGPLPEVQHFTNFEEELDAIKQRIGTLQQEEALLQSICIVSRKGDAVEDYHQALEDAGISTFLISRDKAEDPTKAGVRLATMHRVKGLEFDHVIVAGVNDGIMPLEFVDAADMDEGMRIEREMQDRALLYVSVTRAKKSTLITSHGGPSRWVL